MWDDQAKTMFRIPWKHAGKQDFRSEEDAAIFKVTPSPHVFSVHLTNPLHLSVGKYRGSNHVNARQLERMLVFVVMKKPGCEVTVSTYEITTL